MKHIIIFVSLFISVTGFAQAPYSKFPMENGKIVFKGVESADSLSKEQISKRARIWLAEHVKDSKFATELSESDVIMVNVNYQPEVITIFGGMAVIGYVEFTIKLDIKDGKYRYEIKGFNHKSFHIEGSTLSDGGPLESEKAAGGMGRMVNSIWKQYKIKTLKEVNSIIIGLHEYILAEHTDKW